MSTDLIQRLDTAYKSCLPAGDLWNLCEEAANELERLAAVEAARDQLRADLANALARDIHTCHDGCTRAGCVNARLRAEVEALRADKDRINWLTQHGATIYTRDGDAIYDLRGHMTIRSAIDEARKA